MGIQPLRNPTKEQLELAKWLAAVAMSPYNPGYLPRQFIPQPEGAQFGENDYMIVAELATNNVMGSCIMYLPQNETFYFQPIIASLPVVPLN